MCVGLYLDTHFHITFSESPFKKKKNKLQKLTAKISTTASKKKKIKYCKANCTPMPDLFPNTTTSRVV